MKIPGVLFLLALHLTTPSHAHAQSMVELLSNPDRYDHKKVQVSGYLHQQFEDSVLYLSKEDADYLNAKQGFWISYGPSFSAEPKKPLSYFDCKRVLIEGVFNKDVHGHMGASAGAIENVSRIVEEWRWFDGNKPLRSATDGHAIADPQ